MYVDVTSHCYDLDTPIRSNSDSLWDISKKESVIVGCNTTCDDNDDTSTVAIWRGSVVARGIRKFVYDNLGFTLSAGISINKLL
jgi:nucleotidyltransferase/DNA polymerase involved in DNA repair